MVREYHFHAHFTFYVNDLVHNMKCTWKCTVPSRGWGRNDSDWWDAKGHDALLPACVIACADLIILPNIFHPFHVMLKTHLTFGWHSKMAAICSGIKPADITMPPSDWLLAPPGPHSPLVWVVEALLMCIMRGDLSEMSNWLAAKQSIKCTLPFKNRHWRYSPYWISHTD